MQVCVAFEAEIIIPHFCNGGFLGLQPESNEGFIEDQAFSRSYDLARPPPSSADSKLDRRHTTICRRETGEGEGGAKSYDGEKAWSSINHSLLSCLHH
jgi:hypothetical protein